MIKAIINNQAITVVEGTTIIEAADLLKIPIPRLCYHNKLSVVASCRVCLVEVKNSNDLLPACATLVVDGMQIFTTSDRVIAVQKNVMELLLANHPLECPVCDKAGECELQDLSIQFGNSSSMFKEDKTSIKDVEVGSLITTNMNRCINCTRCVRFSEEIAGYPELGVIFGGDHVKISTFFNTTIDSELSGNMIDLCPVGALNSKPYQGIARSWELQQTTGIGYHDCIGSNINYHIYNRQIKRIVPNSNNLINDIWISDRDRFSYTAINDISRLKHPLIKQNGAWRIASWDDAVLFIRDKLSLIIEKHGAEQIGGLISPNASLEECYLFQKLLRNLGSNNIDHRLRQVDFSNQDAAPLYPNLGLDNIQDLAKQRCILLIGSYINKEQPIAGLILRKAEQQGADIIVINPVDFEINCKIKYKYIADYGSLVMPLLQISKAIIDLYYNFNFNLKEISLEINNFFKQYSMLKDLSYGQNEITVADLLLKTASEEPGKTSIILGALAINHPNYSQIVGISNFIAKLINATWGCLSEGANSAGAWLAGCVPHRSPIYNIDNSGQNALQMLTKPLKSYFLFGIEPELDCAAGPLATSILQQAELVIALTSFESELLLQYAEVLLPINLPPETHGTYVNVTGIWQKFNQASANPGISKAGADILLELGKALNLSNFSNFASEDIKNIELIIKNSLVTVYNNLYINWQLFELDINLSIYKYKDNSNFILVAPIGLYAVDIITRHAECLQQTKDAQMIAYINSKSAELLDVSNKEIIKITAINNINCKSTKVFKIPVVIDNKVANGCILIYQVNLTTSLGLSYNHILIEKIMLEKAHV